MSGKRKGSDQRGTKAPPSEFARRVVTVLKHAAVDRNLTSAAALVRLTGLGRSNFYEYWNGTAVMDLDQFKVLCDALRVEPSSVIAAALGLRASAELLPAEATSSGDSSAGDQVNDADATTPPAGARTHAAQVFPKLGHSAQTPAPTPHRRRAAGSR